MARLYGEPAIGAYSEVSMQSLLLGRSTWTVYNDRSCSPSAEFSVNVSLSSCRSDQFACDDGRCINLTARCDGTAACLDGSDEADCRLLQLTGRYNREIAPPDTTVGVRVCATFWTLTRRGGGCGYWPSCCWTGLTRG